jgi:hypothetical protein
MKKIILLFPIFIIILSSCGLSNQQKAEKEVKRYLLTTLKNPDSYKSVSYSEIKPYTLDFKNTKIGESMYEMLSSEIESISSSGESFSNDPTYIKDKSEFDKKDKEYKNSTESNGWIIIHKYSGTNGEGAIITEVTTFYLDSSFYCVYSK